MNDNITPKEAREAWDKLKDSVFVAMGIPQLTEWLANMMKRWRR